MNENLRFFEKSYYRDARGRVSVLINIEKFMDKVEYIEFLYNHRTDELQKLIDSGKLYRTVMQRVHKANKLIDSTLHEWESQDEEIILAKKSGNNEKYRKLLNGLRMTARTEIYREYLFR